MTAPATITWLTDANGNRCSVEYFGSREAAQKALDSLKRCENCTNCSDCSDCSYCSDCSDCSYCSYCSYCSGCSNLRRVKGMKGNPQSAPQIPKIPQIHQRVRDAVVQPGALDMSTWHTCDTTHCRAGWVVQLAGAEGKALESFHNTALAAALIYRESSPIKVPMPRFYDDDDAALADIQRLAKLEAESKAPAAT